MTRIILILLFVMVSTLGQTQAQDSKNSPTYTFSDPTNQVSIYTHDASDIGFTYEITDKLIQLLPPPLLPSFSHRLVNQWDVVERTVLNNQDGYQLRYRYRIRELPTSIDTTRTDNLKPLEIEYFFEIDAVFTKAPHQINPHTNKSGLFLLPYKMQSFPMVVSLPLSKSYPFKPEYRAYNDLYIIFDNYRYLEVRIKPTLDFKMPSVIGKDQYHSLPGSKTMVDYLKPLKLDEIYKHLQTFQSQEDSNRMKSNKTSKPKRLDSLDIFE